MLILSGKEALKNQIGDASKLEKTINHFIQSKRKYEIKFLYYDRTNRFKVKKVKKKARSIRNFILKIEKKWGDIDVLLLLGGDKIIPFFRLANPCDDGDEKVLSDNPYASRDNDFLIPERICARIPDSKDANFIIKQFKKFCKTTKKSFGVSAKIWKKASENVYRQIGNLKDLKISPPVKSNTFKTSWLQKKDFLYFNLHGSKISPNWYGQDGGKYPVALTPKNIGDASGVVASEACYGAYIINKSHKNRIALKFLNEKGICGFCGSTTIAYGPVAPPSSEADLLVKYFFEYVKQGLTLGESFKNAKLDFARKALRRQGFLDDDDQKTLLQFVLYGDPTFRLQNKSQKLKGKRKNEIPRQAPFTSFLSRHSRPSAGHATPPFTKRTGSKIWRKLVKGVRND